MAKINFNLTVTNNKPSQAQKQLDKELVAQIMKRSIFSRTDAAFMGFIGGFKTAQTVQDGYNAQTEKANEGLFASTQVEGTPKFEIPTAPGTRKPAAGEKKLIDDLFKKYESFDVANASRENLESFIKEITEALDKVKDIKNLDAKIPNAAKLRAKLETALQRRTNAFTIRQSQGISDEQIRQLSTGEIRLEDVFRLTPKNRALLAVREIVSTFYRNQFTANYIKDALAKDAELKDVIFESFEFTDEKGKTQTGYKLRPEFASLKEILPEPKKYKKDETSPEVEYYTEADTVVTYKDLVEYAKRKTGAPVQESVQRFATELRDTAEIADETLKTFVNDALDKAGIAETFGADLQQYNKFVQIPPSVLAMHAVVSSGVMDCFNAAGNFMPGGKQKYIDILQGLGLESPLAKLIIQVTGRDASGNKVPVTEETKEFASLRSSMLGKLVATARTYTERNAIFADSAMLETARRISKLDDAIIEQSFTPEEKTRYEAAREQSVRDNTAQAMTIIDETMISAVVAGLNTGDVAARLNYLDAHMAKRREEFIQSVLDDAKDLPAPTKEDLLLKLKTPALEIQPILSQNGFILQNIAMIESLQNDLYITTANTDEQERARAVLTKYQGQERVLLGLNNAFMDMVEASEEATIVHTIANAVKFQALTKSEAYTKAETDVTTATTQVATISEELKNAEKDAKAAKNKALDAKIEYYCSLYQYSVQTIYKAVLGGTGKLSPNVQKQVNAVLNLIREAGAKLKPGADGQYNFDDIEQIFKDNYSAFLSQLSAVSEKQGVTGQFSRAAETYSVNEMLELAKNGLEGIVKKNPDEINNELATVIDADLLAQYLSPKKEVSEAAEKTILENIEKNTSLSERRKVELKTMLAIAKENAATKNVDEVKGKLTTAQQTLQQCQQTVKDIEYEQIRLPEFTKKIGALEELLLRLETCKKKIESLDFSQFEESKLVELGFSKEEIDKIKAMDIFTVREKFIEGIEEKIKEVKATITTLKQNASEQYSIEEVAVSEVTGETRFVVVDNPRRQYEVQSQGYTIGTGKKATHHDYDPEVALIHPLVIEVADVLRDLESDDVDKQQAAQKKLTEEIIPKLDEIKDEKLKNKILTDIARVRKYDKHEFIVVAEYSPAVPAEDKPEKVEPTAYHDKPAEAVTEEDLKEVRVALGMEKSTVRRATRARETADDVPPVVEEYTSDQAKRDAAEILGETVIFETLKSEGKLDAYIEKVDKLIKKIEPLVDVDATLGEVVGLLKGRLDLAEKAKTPAAEEVRDESVPPVVDEVIKTPKEVVIEKIKAIAIPENIATMTDKEVLNKFVRDAEALCQELKDNADWRGVLAAEELPEYKTLTEALAAAKERVTALSTEAGIDGEIPPVDPVEPSYTDDDVRLFVDSINLINAYQRLQDPETDAATRRQTLIELGLDPSKINEEGYAIEGDEVVVGFKEALAGKLEEAVDSLDGLRVKLPKDTDPAKAEFLEKATEYALTKVTDPEITKEEVTAGLDTALYGLHHPDASDTSDITVDDYDVSDSTRSVAIKQPSFTTKGLDTAIKSAGKLLKNVKSDLAKAKSALAAQKKTYERAILRQGYARLLLNTVLKVNGIDSIPATIPDTMEYEREVGEPAGTENDTFVVIKYLKVMGYTGTYDPKTGTIVATDSSGKTGSVEDVIYDSIEICNDPAKKPTATRRQQILHKHLHTLATREAMQQGADLLGNFLASQKIDVTPENIESLINGTLTKDGKPVTLPEEIVSHVTTFVTEAKGEAPLPGTGRTR